GDTPRGSLTTKIHHDEEGTEDVSFSVRPPCLRGERRSLDRGTTRDPRMNFFFAVALLDRVATAQPEPSPPKFQIGNPVCTLRGGLDVRSSPSLAGNVLGTQSSSSPGKVTGGPSTADGFTWWEVDFDAGVDGWTAEDFLTAVTSFPLPRVPAP